MGVLFFGFPSPPLVFPVRLSIAPVRLRRTAGVSACSFGAFVAPFCCDSVSVVVCEL